MLTATVEVVRNPVITAAICSIKSELKAYAESQKTNKKKFRAAMSVWSKQQGFRPDMFIDKSEYITALHIIYNRLRATSPHLNEDLYFNEFGIGWRRKAQMKQAMTWLTERHPEAMETLIDGRSVKI